MAGCTSARVPCPLHPCAQASPSAGCGFAWPACLVSPSSARGRCLGRPASAGSSGPRSFPAPPALIFPVSLSQTPPVLSEVLPCPHLTRLPLHHPGPARRAGVGGELKSERAPSRLVVLTSPHLHPTGVPHPGAQAVPAAAAAAAPGLEPPPPPVTRCWPVRGWGWAPPPGPPPWRWPCWFCCLFNCFLMTPFFIFKLRVLGHS